MRSRAFLLVLAGTAVIGCNGLAPAVARAETWEDDGVQLEVEAEAGTTIEDAAGEVPHRRIRRFQTRQGTIALERQPEEEHLVRRQRAGQVQIAVDGPGFATGPGQVPPLAVAGIAGASARPVSVLTRESSARSSSCRSRVMG